LLAAAEFSHEAMVRLLIEGGADLFSKAEDGSTPLHCACIQGDNYIVKMFLEKGVDVMAVTHTGHTPLHFAAYAGHTAVVPSLLEKGAAPSAVATHSRETPLHFAASQGHGLVVRLLLRAGADTDAQSLDGETPEECARAENHDWIAWELHEEATRRAECVVFAMGHHDRLGAGSLVWGLDAGVVRMVLDRV